jgi:hypothetical protein
MSGGLPDRIVDEYRTAFPVQFTIPIITSKSYFLKVYERMYSEFQESILYSPSVIDPDNRLTFVLFGENVFNVDSVLAKVDSFEGVKMADAYILTKLQYYDHWILREIDKRLAVHPLHLNQ